MTYLQLINKVLRGLREAQAVTITDNDYVELIGQFVNEAKENIEDLGPWRGLSETVSINTVADQLTGVTVTGANDRSYPLYSPTPYGSLPMVFITTAGVERRLTIISWSDLVAMQRMYPDAGTACPSYVAFARDENGMSAFFWPTADATYTVKVGVLIPQAELSVASTVLQIPARPVWQEALVLAMEERGEEFAGPLDNARARAARSLESAMLSDFGAEPLTFSAE